MFELFTIYFIMLMGFIFSVLAGLNLNMYLENNHREFVRGISNFKAFILVFVYFAVWIWLTSISVYIFMT